MAYSKSIRDLTVELCRRGHSPEEVTALLSDITQDAHFNSGRLVQLARDLSVPVTEADWQELARSVPEAKTIRRWLSRHSRSPEVAESVTAPAKADSLGTDHASDDQIAPTPELCQTSPDGVDVNLIASWGVPRNQAAEILRRWRACHREGDHDSCRLFRGLEEDLGTRSIPWEKARAVLELALWGKRHKVDDVIDDLQAARAFRPWERKENQEALFREYGSFRQPEPRDQDHTKEPLS